MKKFFGNMLLQGCKWANVRYILFSNPPGRLEFSSGALGILMSKAQKLTPKVTSSLALLKKKKKKVKYATRNAGTSLAASVHFTLPFLPERSGVLEHSSGIFPEVLFCSKYVNPC